MIPVEIAHHTQELKVTTAFVIQINVTIQNR